MYRFQSILPAVQISNSSRIKSSSSTFANTDQHEHCLEPTVARIADYAATPPTKVWLTVAQMAVKNPAWSENSLRALIFASRERVAASRNGSPSILPGNGLAVAIRRVGRRVLIDEKAFLDWVNQQQPKVPKVGC